MQIVIDIPEEYYKAIKEIPNEQSTTDMLIIKNGTPLPKCKECKHFEYDSVANVNGIPLIVAHEICKKWGDGCKTSEDGYCFLFERGEENE